MFEILLIIPYLIYQNYFRKFVLKYNIYDNNQIYFNMFIFVYNICMSLFSLYIFTKMYIFIYNIDNIFNIGYFDIINYDYTIKLFYYSKYIEFLDTYFLILKNKKVSWLQYYHHIGAPINMALGYYGKTDVIWLWVILNSFVHFWMYLYYGISIFKFNILTKIKNKITILQLGQFFIGLYITKYFYYSEKIWNKINNRIFLYFTWFYVGILILFFLNFYIKKYIKNKIF